MKIEDLSVHYGRAIALASINLEVNDGEFVTVIGPNGAGKTTLLRAISGFLELEKGKIWYNDELIVEAAKSRFRKIERNRSLEPFQIVNRGIIHCPERRRLFHHLSVKENLILGGYRHKEDEDGIEKDLEKVLEIFPVLADRLDEEAGNFSGGQQQMIAIGRSIMSRPKMLMLDEPSLGLAPFIRREIMNKIKAIQKMGTTILLVEQDVTLALKIADRAYLLEDGVIEKKGSVKEFLKSDYIRKSYLGLEQ